MTIDEAIAHAMEVAERQEYLSTQNHGYCEEKWNVKAREKCAKCAAEHRQLAEWLADYKKLKNSIGAIKLSNMKEALALIRTLKAELNGWKEDPFAIIAEVCGSATDCTRCQWYEKCPFRQNYGSYPGDWRD